MVSPGVALKETICAPLSAGVVTMAGAGDCAGWARAAAHVMIMVTNMAARIALSPPARLLVAGTRVSRDRRAGGRTFVVGLYRLVRSGENHVSRLSPRS